MDLPAEYAEYTENKKIGFDIKFLFSASFCVFRGHNPQSKKNEKSKQKFTIYRNYSYHQFDGKCPRRFENNP